jgi:hypothetical protein
MRSQARKRDGMERRMRGTTYPGYWGDCLKEVPRASRVLNTIKMPRAEVVSHERE